MRKVFTHLILCIGCFMLFSFSASGAPMIKIDSMNFDAGTLKEGDQKSVKHTFVVTNTGTDTLKIEKAKPG